MLREVTRAVKVEFQAVARSVRLVCLDVTLVDSAKQLYRLRIGSHSDFDWTWEGANAWRPSPFSGAEWHAEVVEVDEAEGHIYVAASGGLEEGSGTRGEPTVGEFLVTPFGFLEALHNLYEQADLRGVTPTLLRHLPFTLGEGKPAAVGAPGGLNEFTHLWSRTWSWLWGPPGTGKTYNVGLQVAHALQDATECILVVSTTNKATDGVAISIGRQTRNLNPQLLSQVRRLGSGADVARYQPEGLVGLLEGSVALARWRYSDLKRRHDASHDPEERAQLMAEIQVVRRSLSTGGSLVTSSARVVVTTAFMALREAASIESSTLIAEGRPPFTTVIIDEAGLISRAAAAAMACLASRRVLLVGDPRQLSPISKMARALPSGEAQWLAESGLGHLDAASVGSGVHLLRRQYRMHPEIRAAVSRFQYSDQLEDGDGVGRSPLAIDELLAGQPRAIWYVLDEEVGGDPSKLPRIRADRGPGNKSWLRRASEDVVEKILRYHPRMRSGESGAGLFISPFVAQTRLLNKYFGEQGIKGWSASTTHKQQGAEAPFVIFDTVNAGSTGWSDDEWRRLINVGMSRAKQVLIVLASRLEMRQPYMGPLARLLAPRVLRGSGGHMAWREADAEGLHNASAETRQERPWALGAQLDARRAMRPIFSEEQERLCVAKLDGGPRLVRGVAGSGKTVVLAHWLARPLASTEERRGPHWVVYGNAALKTLLDETISTAWRTVGDGTDNPPARQMQVLHIAHLLELLELEMNSRKPHGDEVFDYNLRASRLLQRARSGGIAARARSLFVDEAQDMGPSTMELLARLVEQRDSADPNSKAINIFYDNAQNLYGRAAPNWKAIGLDMRGRSSVMKESFRATRPIAELALNVLARLRSLDADPDHKELVHRGLVEEERRNARPWWRVRYNHVEGPPPVVRSFLSRADETNGLVAQVRKLVAEEGIRPGDIRVIASLERNRNQIAEALRADLFDTGVVVEEQSRQTYSKDEKTLIITTAHSFKGHEAEVVVVAAADAFLAPTNASAGVDRVLAEALYVALTRARSMLYVSAVRCAAGTDGARILEALESSAHDLTSPQVISDSPSALEQRIDLLELIGQNHSDWLDAIWRRFRVERGPILDRDRAIIAQPLFWFRDGQRGYACLAAAPARPVELALEDLGFRVLAPGADFA